MQTPAKTFPMTWSRDCEQCEAGTTFSKSRRIFWLGCLFHVDHAAFFGPHQEACVSWTMWPVNASTPVPVPVSGWQAWVFFQPNRIAPPTSHKFWSWIDQKKRIQWEANSIAPIFSRDSYGSGYIYIYIYWICCIILMLSLCGCLSFHCATTPRTEKLGVTGSYRWWADEVGGGRPQTSFLVLVMLVLILYTKTTNTAHTNTTYTTNTRKYY